MSDQHLVIVEDEADILELLSYNLKREGFKVSACLDGAKGFELIKQTMPDLILLDLMLPGMDGLDICRSIKGTPQTRHIPIIMVTAKGEESDVVLGLGIGADDYIGKPFSPKELVARVKAVLRRAAGTPSPIETQCITLGSLVIDVGKHKVCLDENEIKFTATEFRILHYLASHQGQVFSRDQLLDRGFDSNAVVIDRNIDVHIRAIRKKLGNDQDFIETIRGVGYRFKELA